MKRRYLAILSYICLIFLTVSCHKSRSLVQVNPSKAPKVRHLKKSKGAHSNAADKSMLRPIPDAMYMIRFPITDSLKSDSLQNAPYGEKNKEGQSERTNLPQK